MWESGETLGPNTQKKLRALLHILNIMRGFGRGEDLDSLIAARWEGLRKLRRERQKAGTLIHQEWRKHLSVGLANSGLEEGMGKLRLSDGTLVHICRVEAVENLYLSD